MKRYPSGSVAPTGLYWCPEHWDLRTVSRGPRVLEGAAGRCYIRLPLIALPLIALLGASAGGVYVLLMPVIGAAAILWHGAIRAGLAIRDAAWRGAALFADGEAPGASHFAGRSRTSQKDWDQLR